MRSALVMSVPPGRRYAAARMASFHSQARTTSAPPSSMRGERTVSPKRRCDVTTPPRCAMPCTSLCFTSRPERRAASATIALARITPCPPTPATSTPTVSGGMTAPGGDRDGDERLGRAELRADGAPAARRDVDGHERSAVAALRRPADRGAPEVEAELARDAAVLDDLERALADLARRLDARTVGDDDRHARRSEGALEDPIGGADVVRIDHVDGRRAERAAQGREVDRGVLVAADRRARPRMRLPAGHGGGAVVEDDDGDARAVRDRVDEPGDAGVEEGRVADDGGDRPVRAARARDAARDADARSHRDARVHRRERRGGRERVAADVPRHDRAEVAQRHEADDVRTPRTEHRRPHRDRHGRGLDAERCRAGEETGLDEALAHALGGELAVAGEEGLPLHREPEAAQLLLEVWLELLHHEQTLDRSREAADRRHGERMRERQLQHGHVGDELADVLVRDPARDDADAGGATVDMVEAALVGVALERAEALEERRAALSRERGEHHVLRRIPDESADVDGRDGPARDERAGVGDARRRAQEDRRVEALAQLEREAREIARLGAVGRLEERHAREARVVPGVLLVLGAVHAGVVGDDDHEAAADARIRRGHERVRGDVQADVLHRHEGARAAERRAERDVDRDLLVRGPLHVDPPLGVGSHERLEDLGARRAGIPRGDADARLARALGDRLVPREEDRPDVHQSFLRSTTRSAFPSLRGIACGSRTVTSTAMPSMFRMRWPTRSVRRSPSPLTRASTWTSTVSRACSRSTTIRYCGASSGTPRSTPSMSDGNTLIPRMTSMSSARPQIFAMRRDVRPHEQGRSSMTEMSPVRYRTIGSASFVSDVNTSSPISPSGSGSPLR